MTEARRRGERQKRHSLRTPAGPSLGTRLSVGEIHDNVVRDADEELRRPTAELFWSALDAGLAIGFSFVAGAYLASLVPPRLAIAATAAGYPLGFVFVVLARSQLFTENTLEPVIPFLNRRDRASLVQVARLWGIVLAGNLLGALAFALVAAWTTMFGTGLQLSSLDVAVRATTGPFWLVAEQAVFAGWLIALMAWLIASTRATGAQIALVWLTTAPIAAFGFRHSVAGSVDAFYRAAVGAAPWTTMIGAFIIPAVLGNIVGGVILVALLNYGQVPADHAGFRGHMGTRAGRLRAR